MNSITIPVNGVYFDQIKAGTKAEEYRLVTDFWTKRLVGREYEHVAYIYFANPSLTDSGSRLG